MPSDLLPIPFLVSKYVNPMPKKTTPSKPSGSEIIKTLGARIEVTRQGTGRPILLLHSEDAYESELPLIDALAKKREVIQFKMPGYGKSSLPENLRTIDDISYLYLDILDQMDLKKVTILGFSVGGWLAAEMATKSCERIQKLVLTSSLGVKFGGPYVRDIEDIYYHTKEKVQAFKFHDTNKDPDVGMLSYNERQSMAVARHREITTKFCWEPYFHNPGLKARLARISVPTLVVWGANDGMTRPKYGRAYAKQISGARFTQIPRAGHYPHVEQPGAFKRKIDAFLG
jgi:pimeloyl-ACP methyl ester carboxylesterase